MSNIVSLNKLKSMKNFKNLTTKTTLFTILISAIYIFTASNANLDLSDGRYMLGMDELITFDSVQNILKSGSLINIFSGRTPVDGRYGSTLYYSSAIAALPAHIIGDVSLKIFMIRMLQTLTLLSTYILISFLFLRNRLLSVALLITLITLPTTAYFAHVPKPEPIQLLFLTLFLYYFLIKRISFGWNWLFLGLAFGTKITIIVIVPVIMLFAFFRNGNSVKLLEIVWGSCKSVLFFIFGWLFANPTILWRGFDPYLSVTFHNTTHGADDPEINVISWIMYIINDWLVAPVIINILFSVTIFSIIIVTLFKIFQKYSEQKISVFFSQELDGIFISILGMVMVAAIMFNVQRLWGFYLHIGFILIILGCYRVLDAYSSREAGLSSNGLNAILISLTLIIPFSTLKSLTLYEQMSKRSLSPQMQLNAVALSELKSYLSTIEEVEPKYIKIGYDPYLFLPDDTANHQFIRFWSGLDRLDLEAGYDIIVSQCISVNGDRPNWERITTISECFPKLRDHIKKHIDKPGTCTAQPCYKLRQLGNAEHVMVLEKLNSDMTEIIKYK